MMLLENILLAFEETTGRLKEAPCLKYKKNKDWNVLSWNQSLEKVIQISEGLKKMGIKRGDKVCILSLTRYEWTLTDLAILSLGAITVPIYQSTLPDEALHILNDSGAKAIFVEDKNQLEKVFGIRDGIKSLKKIILFTGKSNEPEVLTFKELMRMGEGTDPQDFSLRIKEITRDDLATLVYTSGTTGMPKGVMLTHDNIIKEVEAMREAFQLTGQEVSIMFLPLAHILARAVQFFQLAVGFVHAYAESIDHLVDNIQEVNPHFIVAVPRIFEKIHTKVMSDVENASLLKQKIFQWASDLGRRVGESRIKGQKISLLDSLSYSVASSLVFSKLHEKLGGRIRFFVSGGAPLAKEIAEFFNAAGLVILEGYGLTETTGATNVNTLTHCRFGTVGQTVKYAEQKIAEDGEILVRGGMVFKGYYNNPQATAEAFVEDWFKTGDIGEFDQDGHLRITDRKKDIIVTAAGKNVAPQNIENLIKTEPVISQVMVHGDKRKYLSALITLNEQEVHHYAQKRGLNGVPYQELVQHPKIFQMVKKLIDEKNRQLPSYETIKKFAILGNDFSIESGELTPSLKVKRKFVSQKYKEVLDSLYKD
ncbi:MAG: long-chain fatty acid--CoA ligase [Deltaproteobacteria bacterium]|nr:long-chain fatty acid--CoA ligase [Deltaproteobacteria bacterium]